MAAANGGVGVDVGGGTNDAVNGGNANNCMEFLGPITGLVYLMKDPRDPLLHIYLFECEAVEELKLLRILQSYMNLQAGLSHAAIAFLRSVFQKIPFFVGKYLFEVPYFL
ncbi:unnamed protein product, partial [Ceratitis capitata]